MKKINRRSGFTLPEVLVTVTVVAVLAAVVVPAVTQYVGRGGAPATQTDLSQIQNAITGYAADTHAYPTAISQLAASSGVAGYKGPYLSASVTAASGGTGTFGSTTGVSVGDDSTAFTSSGLGVSFADSISKPSAAGGVGYLWLHVAYGTPCSAVTNLNTAFPGQLFSTTNNFTTTVAYTCTGTSSTVGVTDNIVLRFVTTGQ